MATTNDLILYRYSPENMPEDVLRKLFVGRDKQFKSLVKEIENAARKKTPRFYLIVGPRGIGKSHFLVLLYHEIQNKLGSILIPIKLREEEYSVYRTSDLFLRILEENNENTKNILSLAHEDEILRAAIEKLKEISRRDGKRYIVFIENLHELFKQLDTKELQKLRSIFQKYDIFSIVATAPMIFPNISEHDEPFYNFFQVQYLSEFKIDEIKELIQKIAEAENNQKFIKDFGKYEPKIHGMAHLTGGSPRLVILFYEMVTKEKLENAEKAFYKIIDEHTPYYQEIFQLLTGQKRKIFDIIILSREPLTPKQISKEARIELPTVTTQLKRLEQDGYILSRPMGRYTKYEVRERLFRLWREMRQPLGRKRVTVLLEFLQCWYTPEERKELFKAKFELLEAGEKTVLRDLCYYAEIQPPESKAEALLKLTSMLIRFGESDEAADDIQQLKEIAAKTKDKKLEGDILLNEGGLLLSKKQYYEALQNYNKILEMNPKNEVALLGKGFALEYLERYEEALNAFNKALEINPEDETTLLRKESVLEHLERYEEALDTSNKALEINSKNEVALLEKGSALDHLKRYEEALDAFNKALEINPKYLNALGYKGCILRNLKRYDEALLTLNNAIEIFPKNEDILLCKGCVLGTLNRFEEALEIFNKVLEINPRNTNALSKKGAVIGDLGRFEEALEIFNKVLEINPRNEAALKGKATALEDLGRYNEALKALNMVLEINPHSTDFLIRKGHIIGCLQGKHESALNIFNEVLKISPLDENALAHKGNMLSELKRYEEALAIFSKILEINPKSENALLNMSQVLLDQKRYSEALEIAKRVKAFATDESYKILATLILIKANVSLNVKTDIITEIENIKNKIANQDTYVIEYFIEVCFILALDELKVENRGNAIKFLEMAYNASSKLKEDVVNQSTITFLKGAADFGQSIIKAAVEEVIKLKGNEYHERIRPIIKALEIVETKDIQKYYDLQVEEREIVADIVRKITKSDELLPAEIKVKDSYLTDYTATA